MGLYQNTIQVQSCTQLIKNVAAVQQTVEGT